MMATRLTKRTAGSNQRASQQNNSTTSPSQMASTVNTFNRPESVGSRSSSSSDDLIDTQPKSRGKKRRSLEDGDKEEKAFFMARRQRRTRKEKAERLALRSVKEPPPKIARNPRELRHLGIEGIVAEEKGKMNPLRDPARKFPRLMEKYPRFINRTDGRTTLREAPQMGLDIDGNNGDQDDVRAGELPPTQERSNLVGVPVVSAESQVSEWLIDVPMPPLDEEALARQYEDNRSLTKQRQQDLQDVESVPLGPPTESNSPAGETGNLAIAQQLARLLKDNYHVQGVLSLKGRLNEEYILETLMPAAIAAEEDEEDEVEAQSLFVPVTESASKDASDVRERARRKAARSVYQRLRQLIEDMVAERENRAEQPTEAEPQNEAAASSENTSLQMVRAVTGTHEAELINTLPAEPWEPPTGPRATLPLPWPQQDNKPTAGHWRFGNSRDWKTLPHRSANRYRGEDDRRDSGFAPVSSNHGRGGNDACSTRSWTPAAAEPGPYRAGNTNASNESVRRDSHVNNWYRSRGNTGKALAGPSVKSSWTQSRGVAASRASPTVPVATANTSSARPGHAAAGWTKSTWYKDTKGGSRPGGS